MQKIIDLFFSPAGRIPRGLWWATLLVYAVPAGLLLMFIQRSCPELAFPFQILLSKRGQPEI